MNIDYQSLSAARALEFCVDYDQLISNDGMLCFDMQRWNSAQEREIGAVRWFSAERFFCFYD